MKNGNTGVKVAVVLIIVAVLGIVGYAMVSQSQQFVNLNLQDDLGALAFGFDDDDIMDVDVVVETNTSTVRMTLGNPPERAIIVEMSYDAANIVFNKYKDTEDASTFYEDVTVYSVKDADTTLIGTDSKFKAFGINGFYFFITDNIKDEFGCMLAISKDCRREVLGKLND